MKLDENQLQTFSVQTIVRDSSEIYLQEIHKQSSMFSYAAAVVLLRMGLKCDRKGWNGSGQYVSRLEPYMLPSRGSVMSRFLVIYNPTKGVFTPWVPSQSDQLTNDWRVVESE